MSTETFEVDYDTEAVWFDGTWVSREELARKIKGMIDGGDYRVARPSAALERLESALANARVLAVRVAPELADALEAAASRAGRPAAALMRDALSYYVTAAAATQVAAQAADGGAAAAVVTEPVSPGEAVNAVELAPKRREGPPAEPAVAAKPENEIEKSWYGR